MSECQSRMSCGEHRSLVARLSYWLAAAAVLLFCGVPLLWAGRAWAQASPGAVRSIRYADLPQQLQGWLTAQGITRASFADYVAEINRHTTEREERGEFEHLIYYALQSTRFTARARVEPAVSAYLFVRQMDAAERQLFLDGERDYRPTTEKIPSSAAARLHDLAAVLVRPARRNADDAERLSYFAGLVSQPGQTTQQLYERLCAEYARAMRFLYRKEFLTREVAPEHVVTYVASLYEERGHSTDTQIEANFALYTALAVIKAQSPETRIESVLIVGPGLDFAPRTALVDLFGPQCYQPFAVADALISLKLADADRLRVHCVDINDRVIAHLQQLPQRESVELALLSGIAQTPEHPLSADYKDYFRNFGRGIGAEEALAVPPPFSARLHKRLRVSRTIATRITAGKLNIITERYDPPPAYDLIIVTNVFPYFNAKELLLAAANVTAMMKEGGYLLHNEPRGELKLFGKELGAPLMQSRTVLIAEDQHAPLFDGVAIHRKMRRN